MQDCWYADKRDLIKWGVLLRLAERFEARRIVQLAFYRPSKFGQLEIDGRAQDIPEEVIAHFRNLRTIGSISPKVRVTVFDPIFEDRNAHLKAVLALLSALKQERCIIFLDPDTGLEPQKPSLKHVLDNEARKIWDEMKTGDLFVFYQHQTNRSGEPWIGQKQKQLAGALEIPQNEIKKAEAPDIAKDVVFFFMQKAQQRHAEDRTARRR